MSFYKMAKEENMLEEKIKNAYDTFKDYAKVSVSQREIWDNRMFYLGSGSTILAITNSIINDNHYLSGTIALVGVGGSLVWYMRNKIKFDVPIESMIKVYRAKVNEVFLVCDSKLNKGHGLISGVYFNKKLVFAETFGIRNNNKMVSIENDYSFYMRLDRGVYRVGEVAINNHKYINKHETEERITITSRGIYISIESTKLAKKNFHLTTTDFESNEFMGLKRKSKIGNFTLFTNEDNIINSKILEEIKIEDEDIRVSYNSGSLNLYYKYLNNYKMEENFRNTKFELKRLNSMVEGYYKALELINIIYDNIKQ